MSTLPWKVITWQCRQLGTALSRQLSYCYMLLQKTSVRQATKQSGTKRCWLLNLISSYMIMKERVYVYVETTYRPAWNSAFFNLDKHPAKHPRRSRSYTGCSKKTDPLICFCNSFGKCTPILILFSLLQQKNYGVQNLIYFSHLTFFMLPLYPAKQTLMLYQCHYYVNIVFVHNLLHFNAFNHLHRLIWAE